jgi:hypothetical protein
LGDGAGPGLFGSTGAGVGVLLGSWLSSAGGSPGSGRFASSASPAVSSGLMISERISARWRSVTIGLSSAGEHRVAERDGRRRRDRGAGDPGAEGLGPERGSESAEARPAAGAAMSGASGDRATSGVWTGCSLCCSKFRRT